MTDRNGDGHSGDEIASMTASELSGLLDAGSLTSTEIVGHLVARIESMNRSGPRLHCVNEIAPDAFDVAAERDRERAAGSLRGSLHGLPILVKDNIDTVAPLHTTGGSLVFGGASPGADALLVTALRGAGAIVIGKTSMSEWANFRSRPSTSGWSAVAGQTHNPHALDRTPGGSSSGSGAALAARLTPLAVGTETDGSILCPAGVCGVAGLKPTVGLVSRTGIIPISSTQDTAGPMARSVEDLALVLEVMSAAPADGEDGVDLVRPRSDEGRHFRALLGDGSLDGVRIGVCREGGLAGYSAATDAAFASALESLRGVGAAVVDPVALPNGPLLSGDDEQVVLVHEFRVSSERYFSGRPGGPASLVDVIAHAESVAGERRDLFGVELLAAAAAAPLDRSDYERALAANRKRSRTEGIDRMLADNDVQLIAVPTCVPAWPIDHVLGDQCPGNGWSPPAVAGYPSATLPIGLVHGLPVGITLWGPPWSEALLLRVLFALERDLGVGVTAPVPTYAEHAAGFAD